MATIRPSSDLRNNYSEISEFCHTHSEPVFITKNGYGDLVVMSNDEYSRLCNKAEFYRLLDEGLAAAKRGDGMSADEFFKKIDERFGL